MIDELKGDYSKKVDLVRDIEQQQFHAHEQIQKLNAELDVLKRQQNSDEGQINDLQVVIDRLTAERNDLMEKLDRLNRTYDNCVMEITRERSQMD